MSNVRRFAPVPKRAPAGKDPKLAFIGAAQRKEELPWTLPHVRDDLMVQLNVKQPERVMLKVEWLAHQEGISKRELVERALSDYVDHHLRALGLPER